MPGWPHALVYLTFAHDLVTFGDDQTHLPDEKSFLSPFAANFHLRISACGNFPERLC